MSGEVTPPASGDAPSPAGGDRSTPGGGDRCPPEPGDERLARLGRVLTAARRSPFYRARLPEQPPESWNAFAALPLLTKADCRAQSPFGLVAVPPEERYQYHESFGTTGRPVSVWLTRDDFAATARQVGRLGVGLKPGDVVLVRYPYAISQIAHTFTRAAQEAGACVVAAGSRSAVSPFTRVIGLMQKLEVSVLAALPLQALLLAETAELLRLAPSGDFPALRAICTAGELLTPRKKRLLERIWGVPVYDNYGMTEVGAIALACPYGRLHPQEDDFVLELLADDLATPVAPGELGQLVVTTLKRRATPMIRYVTGDRARLMAEACPCGAALRLEVRGRAQDALTIGERSFDLWTLDAMAGEFPEHRFWVAGPAGRGLHFVVEAETATDAEVAAAARVLSGRLGFAITAERVPKGVLFDRRALLDVGTVGKPRYLYSAEEMAAQAYRHAFDL